MGVLALFSGFSYIREPLWIGAGQPICKGRTFSLVVIYERVGKSVIVACKKRPKRANR